MKDAHFTILGFTAATGEPVMCCIIFACKELEPMMVQGLDPFATWEGDELDIEKILVQESDTRTVPNVSIMA